ncbi:sulfatase-like hydrolase/transferase [Sphingobacterium faecium]|uniref:alkaline phosphatase n=1 Tax=Sphingobacterium faecium TaxID=34087 RepID=UPI0012919BF7|nr:alkaline phosphatase [Sphingobacterium faecium]MQP29846.1 sulfatase-like hydrolase/transferase [Sphingobacterium faecium]
MKKNFIFLISLFLLQVFSFAQTGKIKHVVLVGFDGLGAYAVPKAEMPNLKHMMQTGSYSLDVRTVLPSSSAVNWASMLMGAGPTMHGYTEWGSQKPEIPSIKTTANGLFPSLFNAIASKNPKATFAVIHSWPGIGYLIDKKVVQQVYNMEDNEEKTLEKAIEVIKKDKPTLTFIHFDQPDGVGHQIGHNTPEYFAELKNVDKRIGQLQQAVKDAGIEKETIFVIAADHGGIDKGHGGKTLAEVEIPFIMTGPGVPKGKKVEEPMVIYDIAPTLTWLLGASQDEVWRGKPIKSFQK